MNDAFVALMRLQPLTDDTFEGPLAPEANARMFGGQFLAQGLRAAQHTLPDARRVHSLHAYFLRPGAVDRPTRYEVERVRDGRAYSARLVTASQQGKLCFRMMLSFQVPTSGLEYTGDPMPDVPSADTVEMTYDAFAAAQRPDAPDTAATGRDRPVDIRYVNPPVVNEGPVTEPQRMWMRVDETLPADGNLHDAGLAYLSDTTLVDHVLLPHGRRWQDAGFDGASLDHAMWFHQHVRADQWLLFDQTVLATAAERGLANGRFYDATGTLVVTCMQEGLMRWA